MMTLACDPAFYNNTLTRNRTTGTGSTPTGAGICAYSGSSLHGVNNIIYDNFAYSNPNISGTVTFGYSCVQGGLAGTGNISAEPLFVNTPPSGYCFLSQTAAGQSVTSPCVDAGHPSTPLITGSTRTDMVQDAGVMDMGFHWTNTLVQGTQGMDLIGESLTEATAQNLPPASPALTVFNYPNPFNPSTVISFELRVASFVKLEVFDVQGERVGTGLAPVRWYPAGIHETTFDGVGLPSGLYFAKLTTGDFIAMQKMVLLK